jgi:hypothetical protein
MRAYSLADRKNKVSQHSLVKAEGKNKRHAHKQNLLFGMSEN